MTTKTEQKNGITMFNTSNEGTGGLGISYSSSLNARISNRLDLIENENVHSTLQDIVTVCVFVCHLFSFYPFYFDFHSARIIFDVSSGFYLWNINKTTADICKRC